MSRAGCLLFGFFLGCMTQCAKAVEVSAPVNKGTYAYMKVGEVFHVAAVNQFALNQALKEIGCGVNAQCAISRNAELFIVEIYKQ